MRSKYEKQILDAFLKIYSYHHNAIWTYETLDYMIFVEHAKEFYQLTEDEQWEIRNLMGALKKIYK